MATAPPLEDVRVSMVRAAVREAVECCGTQKLTSTALAAIMRGCISAAGCCSELGEGLTDRLRDIGRELQARDGISRLAKEEFSHSQPARRWLAGVDSAAANCYDKIVKHRNCAAHRRRRRRGSGNSPDGEPSSVDYSTQASRDDNMIGDFLCSDISKEEAVDSGASDTLGEYANASPEAFFFGDGSVDVASQTMLSLPDASLTCTCADSPQGALELALEWTAKEELGKLSNCAERVKELLGQDVYVYEPIGAPQRFSLELIPLDDDAVVLDCAMLKANMDRLAAGAHHADRLTALRCEEVHGDEEEDGEEDLSWAEDELSALVDELELLRKAGADPACKQRVKMLISRTSHRLGISPKELLAGVKEVYAPSSFASKKKDDIEREANAEMALACAGPTGDYEKPLGTALGSGLS